MKIYIQGRLVQARSLLSSITHKAEYDVNLDGIVDREILDFAKNNEGRSPYLVRVQVRNTLKV